MGHKAMVVAAAEVQGAGSCRVRLKVVPDATAASLSGFVKANVATGAAFVMTDAWQVYAPLRSLGYRHSPRAQGDPRRASKTLPRVHRVFGNLQTWLRSRGFSVSEASKAPRPATSCVGRRKPDKHNRTFETITRVLASSRSQIVERLSPRSDHIRSQ